MNNAAATNPWSFTLVFAVGGRILHAHPGALDEADRNALTAIAKRVIEKRLRLPEETPFAPVSDRVASKAITTMTQSEIARAQGYEGESCTKCCQFKMKRAGHCLVCDECGETTGCS